VVCHSMFCGVFGTGCGLANILSNFMYVCHVACTILFVRPCVPLCDPVCVCVCMRACVWCVCVCKFGCVCD
jgi:hypothetical protein